MEAVIDRSSLRLRFRIEKLPISRDYEWICLQGPEWFRTNLFRLSDIEIPPLELCPWPEGMVFTHLYSPEYKQIDRGKVKTRFDMSQTRCQAAWALYATFCEIAEMAEKTGIDPKRNRDYLAALADLRAHLKTCPNCQKGIQGIFNSTRENPPYGENSDF